MLDLLCDWGVLRMDDGQRSSFAAGEQGDDEALFTIDRKRLASVLGDPFRAIGAGTLDDLLDDEHEYAPTEEGENLRRRHRLARVLAEDPVLYLERLAADELAYFQRQRGYLESRVEVLTGLVAERRAEGTACIDRDRGLTDLPFPANSTRKQVALLLCDFLAGRETVTHEELREAVGRLVERHGESWNRSADSLLDDAVDVLAGLDLLEPAEGGWRPLPLAGRFRSPTVNLARAADVRTPDRFVPVRAGIVNLYEYDDQVFELANGRLLLRGHNTSGKTKALELVFPFALDGDISPHRLDPFAEEREGDEVEPRRLRRPRAADRLRVARVRPARSGRGSSTSPARSG